ncbi:MAG: hypothetical protein COB81_00155 [Flavobacteriaceae bacterium]|nr:MAG: hypothetical protein COB81_00155 [Flavobacteriaceae bacterium]
MISFFDELKVLRKIILSRKKMQIITVCLLLMSSFMLSGVNLTEAPVVTEKEQSLNYTIKNNGVVFFKGGMAKKENLLFITRTCDSIKELLKEKGCPKEKRSIVQKEHKKILRAINKRSSKLLQLLKKGEEVKVVTMGTSLTNGTWKWPTIMTEWLDPLFPGQLVLYNLGVGASATQYSLGAMNPVYHEGKCGIDRIGEVIALKPDVVFIEFGINDAYIPYQISLSQSKKNLIFIIESIQNSIPNVEIILQTTNPVANMGHEKDWPATRPKLEAYYKSYNEIANSKKLVLIDNYPNWLELFKKDRSTFVNYVTDGVHPNLAAYREIVLPEIKKSLLKDKR